MGKGESEIFTNEMPFKNSKFHSRSACNRDVIALNCLFVWSRFSHSLRDPAMSVEMEQFFSENRNYEKLVF